MTTQTNNNFKCFEIYKEGCIGIPVPGYKRSTDNPICKFLKVIKVMCPNELNTKPKEMLRDFYKNRKVRKNGYPYVVFFSKEMIEDISSDYIKGYKPLSYSIPLEYDFGKCSVWKREFSIKKEENLFEETFKECNDL